MRGLEKVLEASMRGCDNGAGEQEVLRGAEKMVELIFQQELVI